MAGFLPVLHAEWTKFRTVRGWIAAMAAAGLVIIALGLFPGMEGSCGRSGPESACVGPVGPDGEEVTDSFFFVHQTMTGDGGISVRVASLTGTLPQPDGPGSRPGLMPWAKAGLIIKDGTGQGSTYAAVMLTGSHGVRMQHDYLHDRGGPVDAIIAVEPRFLRLTRAGDTVTGEASEDGATWRTVDTVRLPGLPSSAQVGMFVTSPQYAEAVSGSLGLTGGAGGPSRATATFDQLGRQGVWTAPSWTGAAVGGSSNLSEDRHGGFEPTGEGFVVTGTGDIAPSVAGVAGVGTSITQTLVGTFAGLIIVLVVGTMFVTAEYRRGLVRTTLAASPGRGQVLAAKVVVAAAVTFLSGLVAAAVVVVFGQQVLRDNGVFVHPASLATEVRVVVGTGALLAVAAALAVGLGSVLRRGTGAVTAAVVTIVLPYLLALTVLPVGAGQWLLRVTPAAAFAIQQSTLQYDQVDNIYSPATGYFPLPPWAGFGVLVGWTALVLGVAALRLRGRDA